MSCYSRHLLQQAALRELVFFMLSNRFDVVFTERAVAQTTMQQKLACLIAR